MIYPSYICKNHYSAWRKFYGKRILQKDNGSDIGGGSGQTAGTNGSNDAPRTWDTVGRVEEGDRSVSLHLQNQRELRHIYDPNRHVKEWEVSGIDPEITALNMVSLVGDAPYERLFFSDGIKRLNSGRLPGWILKKYSHLEHGGWWASGIDPLTGLDDLWGCFKPDKPRIDATKGKYQKYEHPLKTGATLFCLRVTWKIGLKIAIKNGLGNEYRQRIQAQQEATQNSEKASTGETKTTVSNGNQIGSDFHTRDRGVDTFNERPRIETEVFSDKGSEDRYFWEWVSKYPQIDIVPTEGVKKAAALLSQGFCAIGLPGIWGGYRKNDGQPCLLPQLEVFAKGGRQFKFAFDQDEKPKTRLANRKAVWHTAKLLKDKGCSVFIIEWEAWIKGVDDLIVAKGAKHFTERYSKALSFDDWQADGLKNLTHKVALRLDSSTKYIGDFAPPPSAKLICLKAPKGSGKTEWLVKICADAQNRGQKVIVITHRQQLGQALCSRFGIDYVSELKDSDTQGVFGFGLCFDSLRRGGQAKFNPDDWQGAIVILDECEQSLWHLLNARTEVAKHRVEVLRNFQQLIQNTLESDEGKVYLSDADLSDLSVNYVRSLANFSVEPWIAVKEGNPTPWNVTVWETCDEIFGAAISMIRQGNRIIISVDGQKAKSKWGTRNLERHLKKLFPDLRILRIDAESIADPNHLAFGCVGSLNEVLVNYDVVITSPSIETGVSIDIKGHFSAVFDIAQGVIPVASVLQRMSRLREPVPRHIWAKGFGIGRIGNGSTSPKRLVESQQTQFKANFNLLAQNDFQCDFDSVNNFQPQALKTWAKMAARINAGMLRYQHEIVRALVAEGHTIVDGDYNQLRKDDDEIDNPDQIKEQVTESRDEGYQEHCEAIALAPTPDEDRYKTLTEKQSRTLEETHELRKGELAQRYSEELVSNELVKLDDEGEYQKAQLHYYYTTGREFLNERDKRVMEKQLESGEGQVFLPDANRHLKGGKIWVLDVLGISNLLAQNTEFSNESQVLIDLSIKAKQHIAFIKDVLGITVKEQDSPIAIGQKFLRQCFGLALSNPVRRGAKGQQVRYYQPVEISELRQRTLEVWLARDLAARAEAETTAVETSQTEVYMGVNNLYLSLNSDVEVVTLGNKEYIHGVTTDSGDYQSADYQNFGVGSEVEQLVQAFEFCDTAEVFALVIEGEPAEVVEDAIASSNSQSQRNQLRAWYESLQASIDADWGNRIADALGHGVEAIKAILNPLRQEDRWLAFSDFENRFPQMMTELIRIEPTCFEWCDA